MIDMKQNPTPSQENTSPLFAERTAWILLKFNRKQANSTTSADPGVRAKACVVLRALGCACVGWGRTVHGWTGPAESILHGSSRFSRRWAPRLNCGGSPGRGFTLHQLDRQLERLPDELAITRSPMVVVDGLLAMHSDDAVSSLESRTLLRRHTNILRHLAHQHHGRCRHHRPRSRTVRSYTPMSTCVAIHKTTSRAWRGRRRQRLPHVVHRRSGIQGTWPPFQRDPQTAFLLPKRRLNPQEVASSVGVLALHHTES